MKDYLQMWSADLLTRDSRLLRAKITVTGERDQHLGPRWDFARVQISVEPSGNFEVIDATGANEELQRQGYFDWAILGLLDVLLTAEPAPLRCVRITVERLVDHPIDSSQMAFRHAGRDAGRKIIEALHSPKA